MLLAGDRALLQRFRQGDRNAMAMVFDHYAEPLARYLQRGASLEHAGGFQRLAGLRRDELHDVVSETFRRAFEERARLAYDGLAPYEHYLRRIARNLVIDRFRGNQRDGAIAEVDRSATQTTAAEVPSPEHEYQRAELTQLMASFLRTLDATERRFVELRYQQDLSQEEVAARLGQSRRWARSAEVELRRRLLGHLRGTGYLSGRDAATEKR